MEEQAGGSGATSGPARFAAQQGEAGHEPTAAGLQQEADGVQPRGRRQLYDDHFMMWVWKIEMCKRLDKHDRESCPYAHPGELARRRHPSLYQALPCPEARAKKICPRLENCNCSHSTFEYWLHPNRFKTFLCERGEACDRPICFFAHTPEELRELPAGLQRTQPAQRPHAPAAHSTGSHQQASEQGAGSSTGQQGYGSSSGAYQQQPRQRRGAAGNEGQRSGARQQGSGQGPMMVMFPSGMPGSVAPGGPGGVMMVRPEAHRGATVAVIPAGPSVWQNNSLLQSEDGEAPNLEELCVAVTRMAMQQAEQGKDQLSWQQQQQQQQAGYQTVAGVSGQFPLPVLGMQQMLPNMAPLPLYAAQQQAQQQQQQPANQVPQQQQVMLPNGQVVYVQVPAQRSSSAADQLRWDGMQPSG